MTRHKPSGRKQAKAQAKYLRSLLDALETATSWDERTALSRLIVHGAIALHGYEVRSDEDATPALSALSRLPIPPHEALGALN